MKYKDPVSGNIVEFKLMKIEDLEIPPIQRDYSSALASKIAMSIRSVNYFTAPVVVVPYEGHNYVIDGQHRLRAAEIVGLKEVPALVINDKSLLHNIMRLNTEQPPNIRAKALQAVRIYEEVLSRNPDIPEEDLVIAIDSPYLVTAGFALRMDSSFSPSAVDVLENADEYFSEKLSEAVEKRKERARKLLKLYEAVKEKESELLADGLSQHQFMKKWIVSKANPYKRKKKDLPDFDTYVEKLTENVKKLTIDDFSPVESMPISSA